MTLAVVAITDETVVNTVRSGGQDNQDVTYLNDGGWIVTWRAGNNILQQRYDAAGAKVGSPTTASTNTINGKYYSTSVSALSDGGWIVTWTTDGQDGGSTGIYAQQFNASGARVGSEFRVNTRTVNQQDNPDVVGLAGGGYVIVYESEGGDAAGYGIISQAYDSTGAAVGVETVVNTTTAASQNYPEISALSDGGYVVVWWHTTTAIGMQRFDASGNKVGAEIFPSLGVSNTGPYPAVTGLANGGWVVTATRLENGLHSVYQQVYDATGNAVGAASKVNTTSSFYRSDSSTTALDDGRWVVTWTRFDNTATPDVYAQVFNADGTRLGTEFIVNQGLDFRQESPQVTGLADGRIVFTWFGFNSNSNFVNFGNDIYQRVYAIIDNQPPVLSGAQVVLALGFEDSPLVVTEAQLLTGFSDANPETPLSVANLVANNGTVVKNSDGTYTITPNADFNGEMTLSYSVTDGVESLAATLKYGVVPTEDYVGGATTQVNTTATGQQTNPYLSPLSGGGWRVHWNGNQYQDYDAAGVAVGTESTSTGPDAGLVANLSDGTSVVLTFQPSFNGIASITAQRFDSGGNAVGAPITIDTAVVIDQFGSTGAGLDAPRIAALTDGRWVVTWEDQSNITNSTQKWAIYASDGSMVSSASLPSIGQGYHGDGVVTGLADGGFVIAYTYDSTTSPSVGFYDPKLKLSRYDANGNLVANFALSDTNDGNLYFPAIAATPSGGWIVAYADTSRGGIYYQIFNADGSHQPEQFVNAYVSTSIYSFSRLIDILVEDDGDFTIAWSSFGDDGDQLGVFQKHFEADAVYGTDAADLMLGTLGNDVLIGLDGNDTINGGGGNDAMYGGNGNDTYSVDNIYDYVLEGLGQGDSDRVNSTITYVLTDNVEQLVLSGFANIDGTGNVRNNTIFGSSGNNRIDGGIGADTLRGNAGNDTYVVDNVLDVVVEGTGAGTDIIESSVTYTLSTNVEELTLTGSAALNGTGNSLANVLRGNSGNNTLSGAAGIDTVYGGAGDDIYVVDNIADVVSEETVSGSDDGGFDRVNASSSYTLSNFIEYLSLTGTGNISGIGNDLSNTVMGNSGNNTLRGLGGNDTLNGGTGVDTLFGGAGDDLYVVDNAGDVVREDTVGGINDGGNDKVTSYVSYSLSNFIERLTLAGTANINGTGNSLNNVIFGNSGANRLNGGLGTDTLRGLAGDDSYVVDNVLDVVLENSAEGSDLVSSSVSYVIGDNIEKLTLTESGNIDGTGNALANYLLGNSGNNHLNGAAGNDTLEGGLGVDTLSGGSGDDLYKVDNSSDVIVENSAEGSDFVISTVSYTLSDNIERLDLRGSGITGTGNSGNNALNSTTGGANTLFGLGGNDVLTSSSVFSPDTLLGGAGDDTYSINGDDVISEETVLGVDDGGTDTVKSSVSFVLGSRFENLTLTLSSNINATGNNLANDISGNSGNNVIIGGAGNDTLRDPFSGGGDDTYLFGPGFGIDTIFEYQGNDTIEFGLGITAGDIITEVVGNDLYYAISETGKTASQCANRIRIAGGASSPLPGSHIVPLIENVIFTSTPVAAPSSSSAALAQSITAFAALVAQSEALIDTAKTAMTTKAVLSGNLGLKQMV